MAFLWWICGESVVGNDHKSAHQVFSLLKFVFWFDQYLTMIATHRAVLSQ
jgi:hypothetical protein